MVGERGAARSRGGEATGSGKGDMETTELFPRKEERLLCVCSSLHVALTLLVSPPIPSSPCGLRPHQGPAQDGSDPGPQAKKHLLPASDPEEPARDLQARRTCVPLFRCTWEPLFSGERKCRPQNEAPYEPTQAWPASRVW